MRYTEYVIEDSKAGVFMAVFGWFVHYVLIMVILAAVAVAGVFAGRKWAEKSKAKKDTAASGNAGKE